MGVEDRSRVAGSAAGVWTLEKRLQLVQEMDQERAVGVASIGN